MIGDLGRCLETSRGRRYQRQILTEFRQRIRRFMMKMSCSDLHGMLFVSLFFKRVRLYLKFFSYPEEVSHSKRLRSGFLLKKRVKKGQGNNIRKEIID